MNPLLLPPHRFVNYIWTWVLDRLPEEEHDDFIAEMNAPLGGVAHATPTPLEVEAEAEDFAAFYAQVTT